MKILIVEDEPSLSEIMSRALKQEGYVVETAATYAEAEVIGPNIISMTQDGKTLYLKVKGKGRITPTIWNELSFKSYEAKDTDIRRVGFTIEVKANATAEIEVTLSSTRSNLIKRLLGNR